MQGSSRLAHFPISWFASVMGLAGLTIVWEQAQRLYFPDLFVASLLLWLTGALFVVLVVLYLLKLIRYPEAVQGELHHPVKLSFFPAFSISLLLLGTATLHAAPTLSLGLWGVGSALHLGFTFYVLSTWIHQEHFHIQHINPAWFIPVVGNILVPIAGVAHGHVEVSWFFFSIGLVFWGVLLAILFYRMIFHAPLPSKLLPTLFILIAPPAVGFIAYEGLVGGNLDSLARVLFYIALFLTLLLFTQVRRFIGLPFFLSWWAYSFPLAAMTLATFSYGNTIDSPVLQVFGGLMLVVVNAVILLLAIRTGLAVWRREICVEDE